MSLKVHHLQNSRSQRVLWLLEELGLEYEIVRYERDPETMLAPPELREVHPLGKSPLIEDGGRVYAESGNIIEHLVEEHGGGMLRPEAGTPAADAYRFWLHYAEGSLMPLAVLRLIFDRVKDGPIPFFVKPVARLIADKVDAAFVAPQSQLHFSFIESSLGDSTWLCGEDLTAADIQMSFPLEAAGARFDLSKFSKIRGFVKRCHERPAYRRALERGGPYAYA